MSNLVWRSRNFSALLRYAEGHDGNPNCPQAYKAPGDGTKGSQLKVGAWLNTQRLQKKKGELKEELAKRLEGAGVKWDSRSALWERNFSALQRYAEDREVQNESKHFFLAVGMQ